MLTTHDNEVYAAEAAKKLKDAQSSVTNSAKENFNQRLSHASGVPAAFIEDVYFTDKKLSPVNADRLWVVVDRTELNRTMVDGCMADAIGLSDLGVTDEKTLTLTTAGRNRFTNAHLWQEKMDIAFASSQRLDPYGNDIPLAVLRRDPLSEQSLRAYEVLYHDRLYKEAEARAQYGDMMISSEGHSHLDRAAREGELEKVMERYKAGFAHYERSLRALDTVNQRSSTGSQPTQSTVVYQPSNTSSRKRDLFRKLIGGHGEHQTDEHVADADSTVLGRSGSKMSKGESSARIQDDHTGKTSLLATAPAQVSRLDYDSSLEDTGWVIEKVRSYLRETEADENLLDLPLSTDILVNPLSGVTVAQAKQIEHFDTDQFRLYVLSLKTERPDLGNAALSDAYIDCVHAVNVFKNRYDNTSRDAVSEWMNQTSADPGDATTAESLDHRDWEE